MAGKDFSKDIEARCSRLGAALGIGCLTFRELESPQSLLIYAHRFTLKLSSRQSNTVTQACGLRMLLEGAWRILPNNRARYIPVERNMVSRQDLLLSVHGTCRTKDVMSSTLYAVSSSTPPGSQRPLPHRHLCRPCK